MNLYNVFNQILILFSILILGIIIKRVKVVSDEFEKDLTDFILKVSQPALVINSMSFEFSSDVLLKSGQVLLFSFITYGLSIMAALGITKAMKFDEAKKSVYKFVLIFSNVGFMGYPVVNSIYGAKGVFYTAIFNLVYMLLVWTLGIIIISGEEINMKSMLPKLINPGTVSIVIGFTLFVFSIKLPAAIASTINMIGSLTTPLSMILVGLILGSFSIKKAFKDMMVFFISFLRLVVIPLAVLLIFFSFVKDPLVLGVLVIMCAMPAASSTAIFAGKYGGDTYTASQTVFITTLFSAATIPVIVYILSLVH